MAEPMTDTRKTVYIYALCEPDTGIVRYIGKIKRTLPKRLSEHLRSSNLKKMCHKNCWIKSIMDKGQAPDNRLLDMGSQETWEELEQFYILAHRQAGFDLTNVTDGGEGGNGVKPTEEWRKRQSIAAKKRGMHPNSTHRGHKHTPEARKRMSEAQTGHPAPNKGKAVSDEHRAKLIAAKVCNASSGHKGVQFRQNRWKVRLCREGRQISVGGFSSYEEAVAAYDRAALSYKEISS